MGLATVNVTLSTTQMKIEKNGTKQNPPLLDSLPTYCSSELIFKDFFKIYYIILYQAVNILFLHNVFRVCLHGGGGPQIGEVKCGGPPHLSCNCDQIKMREIIWTSGILHQSGLPHLSGAPYLHVTRPYVIIILLYLFQ